MAAPGDSGIRSGKAARGEGGFTLHLIAAATGDLLYRLACVVTTQFPTVSLRIVQHSLVDDADKLNEALAGAVAERSIVLHALADPQAKETVRDTCEKHQVPAFDATGPLVQFVAKCVGKRPANDVSRLLQVDEAYQRRIDAMEFSLEHDDGLGLATLAEADVVIVGVSRVSKSPTAIYLGSHGYKTANVSISPQTGFPSELSRVPKGRVIAFTTQPARLRAIRSERIQQMGVEGTEYDSMHAVIREVMDAETEYRKRGYPIIDVTDMTIEQTSVKIMELLGLPRR